VDDYPPTDVTTRSLVLRISLIAATVVVASLVGTRVVTDQLGPGGDRHAVWIVGDDIGLEYVRNTGAAFGIFQGNAELLAAISILVSIALVVLIVTEISSAFWATLAAGLTVGGSLGNLIGRIADGFVTDYVAVGPWPRFNIADSAITVGIAIFVVSLLFERSSYTTTDEHDPELESREENGRGEQRGRKT
jgi:signal peptidase II